MNAKIDISVPVFTQENNMDLWKSVFITDPSAVKPITGKAYKGNSPKPYWLIEQATKVFGPCGLGWGVEVVEQGFQQCGPSDLLHWATVRVWYVYQGQRGSIEQMGGTKAAYTTNAGKYTSDEDAAKKSITDGMVKCLSMIGFTGDIFSGRWDDSKYVESAAEHHQQVGFEDQYKQALKSINNAQDKQILINIWNGFKGTQFEQNIKQAIAAKRDQMGWQ